MTFGNLYGGDAPAYGVTCQRTSVRRPSRPANTTAEPLISAGISNEITKIEPTSCVVEDCVFDIGQGYHLIGK